MGTLVVHHFIAFDHLLHSRIEKLNFEMLILSKEVRILLHNLKP